MGKAAICQLTSTNDKKENLSIVKSLFQEAIDNNAQMIFFPEAVDYIGIDAKETIELAETLNGPIMSEYKELAKKNNVWLSIGGFHEKVENNSKDKIYNSHVIIDNKGDIASIYRKLHLFDISLPEKSIHLKESDLVVKGNEIVQPINTPIGNLGLSICYDLRFPELSVLLRKMGAQILTYPSAFTTTTGAAHWEILLRAKAIETQCYVIAAAQYGVHNTKRKSYGHSLIIDPWGEIIAECKKFNEDLLMDKSIAYATIDLDFLKKVRCEMPLHEHRRNDLYSLMDLNVVKVALDDFDDYKFAHISIPSSTVFYRSKYSYAFTNIRCVVPGHILVASLRPTKRLPDLQSEEAQDFFLTVIKVQKALEIYYKSNSSTICIQDGINAGQTIPHVHCHILPRKPNDFTRNDDIYEELAKHDRDNSTTPIRTIEEMTCEANQLRMYF